MNTRLESNYPEDIDAKMTAFTDAIDEGDVSPDVVDFDEDAFIDELKTGWRSKKG